MGLCQINHINRLITLLLITLTSFHCIINQCGCGVAHRQHTQLQCVRAWVRFTSRPRWHFRKLSSPFFQSTDLKMNSLTCNLWCHVEINNVMLKCYNPITEHRSTGSPNQRERTTSSGSGSSPPTKPFGGSRHPRRVRGSRSRLELTQGQVLSQGHPGVDLWGLRHPEPIQQDRKERRIQLVLESNSNLSENLLFGLSLSIFVPHLRSLHRHSPAQRLLLAVDE